MKISARTCDKAVEKTTEPDLEFYLTEDAHKVSLMVRDKTTGQESCGVVLSISKSTGKISRHQCINKAFGLPLNSDGSLKLSTE